MKLRLKPPHAGALLLFGLVVISGNPLFSNTTVAPAAYGTLAVVFLALTAGRIANAYVTRASLLVVGFTLVFAVQLATFGFISLPATAFFFVKLLLGGLIVYHYGSGFVPTFYRATSAICLASLMFQTGVLIIGPESFPGVASEAMLGPNIKSIGVHTVLMTDEWWRNSGMFWEPGAFQGVINLALLLTPTRDLWATENRFRTASMIVALASTFSTTGYLVFFAILLYKLSVAKSLGIMKIVLFAALASLAVLAVTEFEFLGAKVASQISSAVSADDFSPDRFGALRFDLHYIDKHPIFGNGFHESTRYSDHPQLAGTNLGHGNGLSNFIATMGYAGLGIYIAGLLLSGPARTASERLMLVTTVLILCFGEQFLNYPLFLALPFLQTARRGLLQTRERRRNTYRTPAPM